MIRGTVANKCWLQSWEREQQGKQRRHHYFFIGGSPRFEVEKLYTRKPSRFDSSGSPAKRFGAPRHHSGTRGSCNTLLDTTERPHLRTFDAQKCNNLGLWMSANFLTNGPIRRRQI